MIKDIVPSRKREPVANLSEDIERASRIADQVLGPAGGQAPPALVQKVSNISELTLFLSQKALIRGVDPKWIDMNRQIINFLAGVAWAREDFNLRDEWSGEKNDPPRDWPYYAANAIEQKVLDAKGSNLEKVIMQYAPGVIGDSMVGALRAIHVVKPKYDEYNLMAFVGASVDKARNVLAGAFRSLVEEMIRQKTIKKGAAAARRLEWCIRRQNVLLAKLQKGCGGLSLETNDCPTTVGR